MRVAYHALSTPETDRDGDWTRQPRSMLPAALRAAGFDLTVIEGTQCASVADIIAQASASQPPEIWVTEGVSSAVPDERGLDVSRTLGIPYVVAEPVLSPNADDEQLRVLLGAADAVITTSSAVAGILAPLLDKRLIFLLPFVEVSPFTEARRGRDDRRSVLSNRLHLPDASPWLVTVADLVHGVTLESFRVLARALSRLAALDWHYIVIGDGPARTVVQNTLLVVPHHRLHMMGAMTPRDLPATLVCCDLFLWPAVGDAGLRPLLEAQAAGLPVVACAGPGVQDRVQNGLTGRVVAAGNAEAFSNVVSFFLRHPEFRTSMGRNARAAMMADRDVRVAGRVLAESLQTLAG